MERDGRQQDIGRYTGYCYGKIRDLPARLAIRITMAESLSLSLSLSLSRFLRLLGIPRLFYAEF